MKVHGLFAHLKVAIYNFVVATLIFAGIFISTCVVKKWIWGLESSYLNIFQDGFRIAILMTAIFAMAYYFLKFAKWVYNQ